MKKIKCPYCEHEFSINVHRETEKNRSVTFRLIGMSKSIGKPQYINAVCKNCRRSFKIKA